MNLGDYLSKNIKVKKVESKYIKGYKFGKLTIEEVFGVKKAERNYRCSCECGGSITISYESARKRKSGHYYAGCNDCRPSTRKVKKFKPVKKNWLNLPIVRVQNA